MKTSSSNRLGRAGAVMCGLVLLAFVSPAVAQDDDELSFEQKIIHGLLGGGGPGINYRERSPLVIPPGNDLPPPDRSAGAAETPSWPNDPDAAKRKTSASNGPAIDLIERNSRPLSPSEMRRGAVRGGSRSNEPVRTLTDSDIGRPLTPRELGENKSLLGGLLSGAGAGVGPEKPVAFAGEPSRSRLIEPPTGYRTPAPTQPYAPPTNEKAWYKPFSWFDRGTERQ